MTNINTLDKRHEDEIAKMCQPIREAIYHGMTITNDRATVENYVAILSHLNVLQSHNLKRKVRGKGV